MRAMLLLMVLGLAGCDPAEERDPYGAHCMRVAKALVKTPSTVKVADFNRFPADGAHEEVFLKFDAQNIFGANVRHQISCRYLLDAERPDATYVKFNGDILKEVDLISVNLIAFIEGK